MLKRGGDAEAKPEIIPLELEAVSTAGRSLSSISIFPCRRRQYIIFSRSENKLTPKMKVIINRREVEAGDNISTLAQLLEAENLSGAGKAVAVDNCIAPRSQWDAIPLHEGMGITVIQAVCGG